MTGTPRRLADFTGAGYDKGASRMRQALWFAVQNMVFGAWWCPAGLRPRILRVFGAKIGEGVFIRHRVRILWPWKLSIGDHSWVGEDVWILNLEDIRIGANVCLSQGVFLCAGSHDPTSEAFEYDNGPIVIEDHAWVAAQVLVLRGVTIGQSAVVGARALVSRDVPPGYRAHGGQRR